MAVTASAVKVLAAGLGLPVLQPPTLRSDDAAATIIAAGLDALVVAAYGLILPRAVLEAPRHGCINIHASLLPRWRGAAPIARAIEAGDTRTGITIMRMDAGLDTGPVLACEPVDIEPADTAGTLHDRLAEVGARMIVDTLAALAARGALQAVPQPVAGATYAVKISRTDRPLDWSQDAAMLARKIRALAPLPGAFAGWRGDPVRVLAASATAAGTGSPMPGTVVAVTVDGIDVACGGDSSLRLARLQPAGGRPMTAAAFAAGRGVAPGLLFDTSAR